MVGTRSQGEVRPVTPRTETISLGRAIWQPDKAKTYQCPTCKRPVFTKYEGDAIPTAIRCEASRQQHVVEWPIEE
jgi:hypothetical protein